MFASSRRDSACARRFFQRALSTSKTTPREVTTDLVPTYPMVLEELSSIVAEERTNPDKPWLAQPAVLLLHVVPLHLDAG